MSWWSPPTAERRKLEAMADAAGDAALAARFAPEDGEGGG